MIFPEIDALKTIPFLSKWFSNFVFSVRWKRGPKSEHWQTKEHSWLVVWNIFYFPIYWVSNHPNWLIFFRGVQTTNQIVMQYWWLQLDSDAIYWSNPAIFWALDLPKTSATSWRFQQHLAFFLVIAYFIGYLVNDSNYSQHSNFLVVQSPCWDRSQLLRPNPLGLLAPKFAQKDAGTGTWLGQCSTSPLVDGDVMQGFPARHGGSSKVGWLVSWKLPSFEVDDSGYQHDSGNHHIHNHTDMYTRKHVH